MADFVRQRGPFLPVAGSALDRAFKTKEVIYVDDDAAEVVPTIAAKFGGARSYIAVPMLKDDEVVGVFIIYRQQVRPFTYKQIELVKNFAAQAVIAIENTRLLNELRQSLEQQTATANVLGVISSSPGELQPVFEVMLENAVRICEAKFANLFFIEGDAFRNVALYGAPRAFSEARRAQPLLKLSRDSATALNQMVKTKTVAQTLDVQTDPAYHDDPQRVLFLEQSGARTVVCVPLMKEGDLVGGFSVYRQEVRPFTGKQITLLQNFAAQAVIAIENARLLSELRLRTTDLAKSLEQQTATSQVLSIISSSPSDLAPVFQAILANATRLCGANFGTLNLYDNGAFAVAALHNVPEAHAEYRRRHPILDLRSSHPLARVAATKQVLQIADLRAEPLYLEKDPPFVAMVDFAGARTLFIVPMLKENDLLGAITIFRQEVRPFSDKQIELVQNFAAQALPHNAWSSADA
jgi:GAF domain-containing protein